MKLAGIGTPKSIIDYVMEKKVYIPYVPAGSIRKNKSKLGKDFEELYAEATKNETNSEESTLFNEEKQRVLVLAGLFMMKF